MEWGMEWESCSTSGKSGDMKVKSKIGNGKEMEFSNNKMEIFTLEDSKMTNVTDLDQSTQLMVKRSSNLVAGKEVY